MDGTRAWKKAAFFLSLALGLAARSPAAEPLRATREASPRLDFLAREIAPQGALREAGHYEVGTDMALARVADESATAALLQKSREATRHGGRPKIVPAGDSPVPAGYVLPQIEAQSPYDAAAAKGWRARTLRSVITERHLADWQGIFYEVPFVGGMVRARPIAAHGRMISDYCCWAGLLVLAGTRPDAEPDGHFFKSADAGRRQAEDRLAVWVPLERLSLAVARLRVAVLLAERGGGGVPIRAGEGEHTIGRGRGEDLRGAGFYGHDAGRP
jgi:hypothetical protein